MLIISLIFGGIALYFIIYKLFSMCYQHWQKLSLKYTWVKLLSEYIEAFLFLLCLSLPACIGFYGYHHLGFDTMHSIGLTLAGEIAVSGFFLGLLIIYCSQKNRKDINSK